VTPVVDESRPPSLAGAPALGDEPEDAAADHGRVGYGRLGRYSPLVLGILMVLVVAGIWWVQRAGQTADPLASHISGELAPDVALTLLDGERLRLADLAGNVVVLNFWASWCAPCREEMPELEAYWQDVQSRGEQTVIVGVGVRTDTDAKARAFVAEGGYTYPIGRDTETDRPGIGPIEAAFGVPSAYPSTVIIRPDGIVDRLFIGPLTAERLGWMVEEARQHAA
jgi:peroxiredoxin